MTKRPQASLLGHSWSATNGAGLQASGIIAVLLNDRLTRSANDLCSLLELFEKRRVALISVVESLDTASAAGRLVITVMAAVSQWEREAIGERTRDALRHKRTSAERAGNIRFGFRLSPDGKHFEPDPGEQGVLTEICHLRQSAHGIHIEKQSTERSENLPSPQSWLLAKRLPTQFDVAIQKVIRSLMRRTGASDDPDACTFYGSTLGE